MSCVTYLRDCHIKSIFIKSISASSKTVLSLKLFQYERYLLPKFLISIISTFVKPKIGSVFPDQRVPILLIALCNLWLLKEILAVLYRSLYFFSGDSGHLFAFYKKHYSFHCAGHGFCLLLTPNPPAEMPTVFTLKYQAIHVTSKNEH